MLLLATIWRIPCQRSPSIAVHTVLLYLHSVGETAELPILLCQLTPPPPLPPPPTRFVENCYSFGWNEGDALGRHGVYDPSPRPVPSLPPIIGISAGSTHSCAITGVGPALGRHLCSLVDGANDDSANVELLAPDAARRGDRGACAYLPSSMV